MMHFGLVFGFVICMLDLQRTTFFELDVHKCYSLIVAKELRYGHVLMRYGHVIMKHSPHKLRTCEE